MSNYKYTRDEAYKFYRENPQRFFNEVIYAEAEDENKLINPNWPLFWTRYHYNLIENGIMEIMIKHNLPVKGASILDIGSGTGHWLEFYQTYFEPAQIWGVDFAEESIEKLKEEFGSTVNFQQWDISLRVPKNLREKRFDLINAIGIIFHIVDDGKWKNAIANLSSLLKDTGALIISGDFSDTTRERGIMRKTRSIYEWQDLATTLNLNILEVKLYDWWANGDNDGLTDNLMALGRL